MKKASTIAIPIMLALLVCANVSEGQALLDEPVARLGRGTIEDIAYSPDGNLLALGTSMGLCLLDGNDLANLGFMKGYSGSISSIAFSPDGRTIASNGGKTVLLWDIASKRKIADLEGHTDLVTPVAFSPDGKYFAFSYFMIYPVLMGLETPPEHRTDFFALTPEGDTDEDIHPHWRSLCNSSVPLFWYMASPLAFSPDGTKMAIVGWSWLDEYSSVVLWDTGLFPDTISSSEEDLPPVDDAKYRLAYLDLSLMPTTSVEPKGKVPFTWGELKPVYVQRAVRRTKLLQNYPNPFNPETWIPFELAQESEVILRIYDAKGSLIREISLGKKPAGSYVQRSKAIHWDGRNDSGEQVASGIYFYTIEAGGFTATRKMIVAD